MARVKTARITRKKHKKILKRAKGYYGAKHYRFRMAKQAVMKSGMYAYVGRKDKKSNFRKLWIARINAAARMNGTTYSKLIAGMKKANIVVNRKMLAELAVNDPKAFTEIAELAKKA
jgi:large subunit ribosomal protein L20